MKSRILEISMEYKTNKAKLVLEVAKNELEWLEGLKDKELNVEIKE